jgi:hypothetical protein
MTASEFFKASMSLVVLTCLAGSTGGASLISLTFSFVSEVAEEAEVFSVSFTAFFSAY